MTDEQGNLKFKRVLLKISGEALMGPEGFGIDMAECRSIALEIKQAIESGAEVCLVIGGGNIFRGLKGVTKRFRKRMGEGALVSDDACFHEVGSSFF